jgi:hypothetical protein
MQRRLPEHAQTLPGLCLIMIVAWVLAAASASRGDDFTLEPDPFETFSTLDSHVPKQNLLWQSTVKGFVSESTRPALQAPAVAVAQEPPAAKEQAPVTMADRPAAKTTAASPFSRWISPRSSATKPAIPSADVTPTPETPSPESGSLQDPQAQQRPGEIILRDPQSAPEVARRTMPRARPAQPAGPSRSQGRRITEILDQDRGPTGPEVDDSELNATPLNGYPEPQAEAEPQKEANVEIVPVKLPPLTKNQKIMRDNVRRVLRYYYERPMNTRDRSPWEVMHCALSYEVHSRILQGGPQGKPVSAVGWLCFNQACRRMKLMHVDEEGELTVKVGPALQGHRGQLLAILAQAKVSSEYPMQVDGHEFMIKDLIRAEMETCYPRTELTFKLIGLMHYLDSETQWVNDQGMQWNMRKLVSEELKQPIRGAACGGTHRLSGLTLAYKARLARGESVDGEYAQAQRFVAQHQLYTFRTQNPDGSFSTNWFQGREDEEDIDRKLKTTGHMLEWLLYSSTDRELKSPRTTRAVYFLTNMMWQNRYRDWEAGPLGHAIHALVVYDRLMFSKYDSPGDSPMAIRDLTHNGSRTTR